MARATSSLPVPLSPVIRTVDRPGATLATNPRTAGRGEIVAVAHVVAEDRDRVPQDALRDGAADLDGPACGGALVEAEDGGELALPAAGEQDGAALRGDDLEDRLEKPALEHQDA